MGLFNIHVNPNKELEMIGQEEQQEQQDKDDKLERVLENAAPDLDFKSTMPFPRQPSFCRAKRNGTYFTGDIGLLQFD